MERIELQKIINEHAMFTTTLYELIKSLLVASDIKYHAIENRTKSIENLEEKIVRKKISNVKHEIMDISGIRIILYYQEDVDSVVDLIKDNFTIDEKNSINKANLYNSNEFGYLSVHYIITLDNKRRELPEWKNFAELKSEIQIRTVLQHSWASISHELTYKKNYEIPKELERKLYRLAGLFELADEQFSNIKEKHNLLKERIKHESSTKIDNSEINLLTLKYGFEKESNIINAIEKIALESGFESIDKSIQDDNEDISDIAFLSDMLGYKVFNEIEINVNKNLEELKLFFEALFIKKSEKGESGKWFGSRYFFITLSMLFLLNEEQLYRFNEKNKWDIGIYNRIIEAINRVKNE